jgi:hypothetical protein
MKENLTGIPINWEIIIKEKRKISILVDNPLPQHKGEGKESYAGYVASIDNDFLWLITPDNTRIDAIVIKFKMILSVWIYKN